MDMSHFVSQPIKYYFDFDIREDSEATEIEGEEEEEEEVNSEDSDSGAWKPKKTWYNSRSVRRPKKSRFGMSKFCLSY